MKAGDIVKVKLPSGEAYASVASDVGRRGRTVLVNVTGMTKRVARSGVTVPAKGGVK